MTSSDWRKKLDHIRINDLLGLTPPKIQLDPRNPSPDCKETFESIELITEFIFPGKNWLKNKFDKMKAVTRYIPCRNFLANRIIRMIGIMKYIFIEMATIPRIAVMKNLDFFARLKGFDQCRGLVRSFL